MKIVWFTWKDKTHPLAGGAEAVNEDLASQLARDGHEVLFLVSGYPGAKPKEQINGYTVIRIGNLYTVYFFAAFYFFRNLRTWPDLIIEEINTIPFMTQWYTRAKKILFIYQLCRNVWFYQLFFPLNIIGYLLEPISLFLLRKNHVITESMSTKRDLIRFGFSEKNISIVAVSIDLEPIKDQDLALKPQTFTLLSLGTIRTMKRTLDQILAFELAKKSIPKLQMIVAGKAVGKYGRDVLNAISMSPYATDIEYFGSVSQEKKIQLMRKSHIILVTSVKEGWGLIVTEAGSQGTPAIVYDVDGLRDSVNNDKTGIIVEKNTPAEMAKEISSLCVNPLKYSELQENTLKHSKKFTKENSYRTFIEKLKSIAPFGENS